jgi:hypothetical protein
MSDALAPSERHKFLFEGRTIYEWDQTLGEVNIYVQLPPDAKARDLDIAIESKHLRIGIKNTKPYLDVSSISVPLLQNQLLHSLRPSSGLSS